MPTYDGTPSQSRLGGSDDVPDALVRVERMHLARSRMDVCASLHLAWCSGVDVF